MTPSPTPLADGATATAHANIALVKYWGKRERALNLPARGSLSLTLEALRTQTRVRFRGEGGDTCTIDEREATGKALARVSGFLDLIRERAGIGGGAEVVSSSNFPAASGLASSASAFAALAVAATRAAGLELGARELSILARRGSGSAARSIFGGLVRMVAGDADEDSYAEPIESPWSRSDGPLRMVIAIVSGGPKKHPSRDAMEHCARTSPLYQAWLDCVDPDLERATAAIAAGDLEALGAVTTGSALAMHASMWAARPAIRYAKPTTIALLDRVDELTLDGVPAYATMDAGPHVKVLTTAAAAGEVAAALGTVAGVSEVLVSKAGPGAV